MLQTTLTIQQLRAVTDLARRVIVTDTHAPADYPVIGDLERITDLCDKAIAVNQDAAQCALLSFTAAGEVEVHVVMVQAKAGVN